MASADEKGCFTLSWDIDNFSAFLLSGDGVFSSPVWKTEITDESALWWFLSIYQSESNVWIDLDCLNDIGIPANCEVTFISSCGDIVQIDSTYDSITLEWSIKKDLLDSKKMHSKTSQDAVTLECKMWQKAMEIGAFRIHSVIEKVVCGWNIPNRDLGGLQRLLTKDDTSLVMNMNLKSTEANNYVFCAMAQPVIEGCFSFVICKIMWGSFQTQNRTESEEWYSDLRTEWRKENLKGQLAATINLEFIVAYHKNGQIHIAHPTSSRIVRTRNMPKDVIGIEPLCEDLLHLYRENILSDATLRNGGISFSAHRSILAARSPVFRAMFEKDETTEGRSGIVNIEDVDHETIDLMLVFLYSDSLEGVQWQEASNLYYAADKYEVQTLKHRCRDILFAGLTINNACEALVLADRQSDGDLMASIVDFIGKHPEVISSKTWEEWAKNNAQIAAEVTRELYLRKVMN